MNTLLKFIGTLIAIVAIFSVFFWKAILIVLAFLVLRRVFCGSRMERQTRKRIKLEHKYRNYYDNRNY